MKRRRGYIALALAGILTFGSISACGNSDNPTYDNNDQNLSDNVTTQKGEPIVEEYLPVNSKRQPEQRELFSEEEKEMEKAIFQTPDELEE